MSKPRCRACGSKQTTPWKQHLWVCHSCKGRFNPDEADVEGGTYSSRHADERLIREELGGPDGYAIHGDGELKGGL